MIIAGQHALSVCPKSFLNIASTGAKEECELGVMMTQLGLLQNSPGSSQG